MISVMSVSFAHSLGRLDGWQQRSPVLAIPVAVVKKFVDDGADRLGVQVAYWGFFSVFALLLVFASILGFVFESNPDLQRQLLDSTLERMPVIGPQIRGDIGTLRAAAWRWRLVWSARCGPVSASRSRSGPRSIALGTCHNRSGQAFSARGRGVYSCWDRSVPSTCSRRLRLGWQPQVGWGRWPHKCSASSPQE